LSSHQQIRTIPLTYAALYNRVQRRPQREFGYRVVLWARDGSRGRQYIQRYPIEDQLGCGVYRESRIAA
jgi:hypothetical protein